MHHLLLRSALRELWFNPTTLHDHPQSEGTLRAVLKQADVETEEFLERS
ncbi:MAG: hypothetical protein ACREXS_06420 [Gammaproteobacteria bacterium]